MNRSLIDEPEEVRVNDKHRSSELPMFGGNNSILKDLEEIEDNQKDLQYLKGISENESAIKRGRAYTAGDELKIDSK